MSALPPGITTRIVLVRHGEPSELGRGRCYGKLDVPLSTRGRTQIRATIEHVQATGVSEIWTSPRLRAKDSAAILGEALAVPVRIDERLAELDFGAFEGLTYDEAAERHPELYAEWMQHPTRVRFPDGECFADMQRRVRAALGDARAQALGRGVGFVAHGGVGRIVLAEALGLPAHHIFRIAQSYAGVSIVDWYDDVPVVVEMNRTINPAAPGGP